MALLLLRNEADCLVPNMETEPVSSHLPPELNRSPITARAVSSRECGAVIGAFVPVGKCPARPCEAPIRPTVPNVRSRGRGEPPGDSSRPPRQGVRLT